MAATPIKLRRRDGAGGGELRGGPAAVGGAGTADAAGLVTHAASDGWLESGRSGPEQ
jgi:hypothetical protein